MTRRIVSGLLGGGVVALLSGCGSRNTFRYKMTVEVETPQGMKSGFAVRELTYHAGSNWFPFGESKGRLYVKGEAVAVDVAPGRTLFALLTGQDGYEDYAGGGVATIFRVMDRAGPKGGPHELWPNAPVIREPVTDPLPMLATFADVNDPKSIQRVEPGALDQTFGQNVTLQRISVQATNEDVTVNISKKLPSFGPETGFDQWNRSLKYGDPRKVSIWNFKQGTDE